MKIVAKSLKMLLLAPGLRLAGILETSLVLEAVMIVADFCVDGFRRKPLVVCSESRLGAESVTHGYPQLASVEISSLASERSSRVVNGGNAVRLKPIPRLSSVCLFDDLGFSVLGFKTLSQCCWGCAGCKDAGAWKF